MKPGQVKNQSLIICAYLDVPYAHVPKDERKKLDPKAMKCILLGYGTETKGYRLYDSKLAKVFYSQDVIFN